MKKILFIMLLFLFFTFGCSPKEKDFDSDPNYLSDNTVKDEITNDFSLSTSIIINEICSKNRYSFFDNYGENSDWIELKNSSNNIIDLYGYGLSLSNDSNILLFDHTYIEPNEFIVVAASGRTVNKYENEYHTPFKLSQKKGGTLKLLFYDSIIQIFSFPALKDDISFGNLGHEKVMLFPTPGYENNTQYVDKQILKSPVFSRPSGIYGEEFELELFSPDNNEIYYTIDCEYPSLTSNKYSCPIKIYDRTNEENILSSRVDISANNNDVYCPNYCVPKCMVIRAICFDDFGNYSPVSSASYWIGDSIDFCKNISIMSISTDFENLFDEEKGIYCNGKIWNDWVNSSDYDSSVAYWDQPANYKQKGYEWERVGNLVYLNENHEFSCEQMIGMRIKGDSTRAFPKKSFNIYSRFQYDGNSTFTYKFNGRKNESLTLRSGGNNYNFMISDTVASSIAKHCSLEIETQDSIPVCLFLNGEFWGLYFIIDKYDSRFFEEKYNEKDAVVFKNNAVEEGYLSDVSLLDDAISKIDSNILTETGFYELCSVFSIDSLIDTILFHSYIDVYDYILFEVNDGCWRSRIYNSKGDKSDTLFRFILYDSDISLGIFRGPDEYPKLFERIIDNESLSYLFKSEFFMNLFENRAYWFIEKIHNESCISLITDYYEELVPIIEQNNYRWFGHEDVEQDYLFNLVIDYLENRANYFVEFLNQLHSIN